MNRLILLLAVSVMGVTADGQENEFPVYPNGLIYSEATMHRLRYIADSLQLKFRHCDTQRDYYSVRQGHVRHLHLGTGDIKGAMADMKAGMQYEDLIKKYPLIREDTVLVLEREDVDHWHHRWLSYTAYTSATSPVHIDIRLDIKDTGNMFSGRTGDWAFAYKCRLPAWDNETFDAFFIPGPLTAEKIPEKYGRWIQYADCMADTSTDVFSESAQDSGYLKELHAPAREAFWHYVDSCTGKFVGKKIVRRLTVYDRWRGKYVSMYNTVGDRYVRDSLASRTRFRRLLYDAMTEAVHLDAPADEIFEDYMERYCSPGIALLLKRRRRVMGRCSQDLSPRIHAMNIARLSAVTANWSVFLKAHMDIMNDRFDRHSDGNYAWGGRKTYLKELEQLDLDIPDLLLGTALCIGNPPAHHYDGDIFRLGRAITESKQRQQLENTILGMIRDTSLDDYNRMVLGNLFWSYLYYLPNKEARLAGMRRLMEANKTMPAYLAARVQFDPVDIEKGAVGNNL